MVAVDNGIVSGTELDVNTALVITAFVSVALYNVVELNFIIFGTFKKRRGLYFWSFFIATWAIAPYALGFLIKGLHVSNNSILYVTMIVIGWSGMVTGQSVVLYSRLHLVDRNQTRLRMVLGMIIVDALLCHVPITAMIYGSNSSNPDPWTLPYTIYEKVQVTIFFVQELIISALYITATVKFFRLGAAMHGKSTGKILRHLIGVNIIIIILDITILGLEYAGYYDLQTAYKALVYSVKLKLEFNILNNLIDLTKSRGDSGERGGYLYASSHEQTGTDGAGRSVAMETFEGTRKAMHRRKKSGGAANNAPGYNAFVRAGGGERMGVKAPSPDGIMVLTTTEVNVQETDGVSARALSMPATDRDSMDIVTAELATKSSSSSEIDFAKSGY